MTAAVYVVGGPTSDCRNDLRHSLRSLTNAPDITEVWCVGDIPTWFTGTRLPLEPKPEKFTNQRASLTAFVNYPGAPSRFYLFNDDHFVTDHVDGQLPTCHLGKARDFFDVQARNSWHRAGLATAAWMEDIGHPDVLAYEAHTPLLFDTKRLASLLNAYPLGSPMLVGELYAASGAGGEGTDVGNAKVKPGDDLQAKLAQPMPYLSVNPQTWDGEAGDLVRSMFTTPCRWER